MSPNLFFLHAESEMVRRIRLGDRKALLELFDRNRRPIVTLVTRNGGSSDEGEDVLQEAVVILWEKIRSGTFEERAALGTFLYGVARRIWLRRLSRTSREKGDRIDPDSFASEDPEADEVMMQDEQTRSVEDAVSRLDPTCRSLLVFFYWENLSMQEIARLMGFANASTAKAKKYQCKERQRQLMQNMSDG